MVVCMPQASTALFCFAPQQLPCTTTNVATASQLPRTCLPQGRSMSPSLRRLLQSGMVSVHVARADGLSLSSLFGRPSV